MTLTFRLAALVAVLFAAALPSRADWSGKLQVRTEPKGPNGEGEQDGLISGHAGKMRIETERPGTGKMVIVIDLKDHKSLMIMEARKAFMTMDMDKMQGRSQPIGGVRCEGDDAAVCLKKAGFTKSGAEVVNGRKSDRWEHDREDPRGGKVHETLWVPQGVKGFAMIKQVSKMTDKTVTLDVLDFKEGAQPDAQFAAPAGYTDMTAGAGMPPGGPGGPMSGRPHP